VAAVPKVSPHKLKKKTLELWRGHQIFLLLFSLRGYWHCGHSWPIVSASGDSEDDCGEADGM
jgi:hypothetical protein